jgi:hypothetical protein
LFRKRKEGEDTTDDADVMCFAPACTLTTATEDIVAGEDTTAGRIVLHVVSRRRERVADGWWRWSGGLAGCGCRPRRRSWTLGFGEKRTAAFI